MCVYIYIYKFVYIYVYIRAPASERLPPPPRRGPRAPGVYSEVQDVFSNNHEMFPHWLII